MQQNEVIVGRDYILSKELREKLEQTSLDSDVNMLVFETLTMKDDGESIYLSKYDKFKSIITKNNIRKIHVRKLSEEEIQEAARHYVQGNMPKKRF